MGFGVKTPEQAREMSLLGGAAVVGSAIVERVRESLDGEGKATASTVPSVLDFVSTLGAGVRAKV